MRKRSMILLGVAGISWLSLSTFAVDPKWVDFETVDDEPHVLAETASFAVDATSVVWAESLATLTEVGLGFPFVLLFR